MWSFIPGSLPSRARDSTTRIIWQYENPKGLEHETHQRSLVAKSKYRSLGAQMPGQVEATRICRWSKPTRIAWPASRKLWYHRFCRDSSGDILKTDTIALQCLSTSKRHLCQLCRWHMQPESSQQSVMQPELAQYHLRQMRELLCWCLWVPRTGYKKRCKSPDVCDKLGYKQHTLTYSSLPFASLDYPPRANTTHNIPGWILRVGTSRENDRIHRTYCRNLEHRQTATRWTCHADHPLPQVSVV